MNVQLRGDRLPINKKVYNKTTLNDLPIELNPTTPSKVENDDSIVFGGIHSGFNYLSNFFPCTVKHNQKCFHRLNKLVIMIKLHFVTTIQRREN